MRNPLEHEEAAFRWVLGTVVYLIPIVLASWIATWLGIVVFVVATVVVVWLLRRGSKRAPAGPAAPAVADVEDTPDLTPASRKDPTA
jgi:membrane protein implicated in regulation of membrane protease activity